MLASLAHKYFFKCMVNIFRLVCQAFSTFSLSNNMGEKPRRICSTRTQPIDKQALRVGRKPKNDFVQGKDAHKNKNVSRNYFSKTSLFSE